METDKLEEQDIEETNINDGLDEELIATLFALQETPAPSELEQKVLNTIRRSNMSDDEVNTIVRAIRLKNPPKKHSKKHISGGTTLALIHPSGGTAYALSYKPQKWAESLSGGKKPDIAGIGHFHKIEQLFYRNIHIFQTGTFESQTPFMARKGLAAMVGAWILSINGQRPFGLLGDTHIGSHDWNSDACHEYYETAINDGVKIFYHTGDITTGERMFRGQEYEIYAHGFDAQKNAVIAEYPQYKGVVTYFITGNHDLSFLKTAGANIGQAIARERQDLIYIGDEEATIKINRSKIKKLESVLIPFYE